MCSLNANSSSSRASTRRAHTSTRLYTAARLGASLMLALTLTMGCTGAQQAGESGALTAKEDPYDRLYQAIEGEVAARGWPVAVASPRFRTLTTDYEPAGQALRKRRTLRVVMLPRGGALRVVVEYERQITAADGQLAWEAAGESATLERAREEELEIGRAVERRFHRLR